MDATVLRCYGYNVIMQHKLVYAFFPFKVLQCKCSVKTVTFPVTVTQQSPAAVSMDTYQVSMKPMQAQVKTTNASGIAYRISLQRVAARRFRLAQGFFISVLFCASLHRLNIFLLLKHLIQGT